MYIYLLSKDNINYKIGVSKNPKQRLSQLQTGNDNQLYIVKVYKSEKFYKKIEYTLHNTYGYKNILNEWFELDDHEITQFEALCQEIENNLIFLVENKI